MGVSPGKNCGWCGCEVPAGRRSYCSRPCMVSGRRRVKRQNRLARMVGVVKPAPWALPSGAVGALGELVVAADLMRRGYEVFRAVSPCAPCDLLVLSGALTLRVEVRTMRRNKYGWANGRVKPKDAGRFDVMAFVEPDGRIHYRGLPAVG